MIGLLVFENTGDVPDSCMGYHSDSGMSEICQSFYDDGSPLLERTKSMGFMSLFDED